MTTADDANANDGGRLDVGQFIDDRPVSAYQYGLIATCFLILTVDGLDTALIGFIAPAIRDEWGLAAPQFAPAFMAGLLGLGCGALVFGPLADVFGRKPVVIVSIVTFGLFSILTAQAYDLTSLTVLRFLTGLGLGGALPNTITLASEFLPQRVRATLVAVVVCGFTFGSAAGGFVVAEFLPVLGWRGVVILCGVIPLAIAVLAIVLLPESVRFMVTKNKPAARIARALTRIAPLPGHYDRFTASEPQEHSPVGTLFAPDLLRGTLLFWLTFFSSLLVVYLLSNWLPLLLNGSGYTVEQSAWAGSMLWIGAIFGGLFTGRLMDLIGPYRAIGLCYVIGSVLVAVVGLASGSYPLLLTAIFFAGWFTNGTHVGTTVLGTIFYPTTARSTGVSWASSWGRAGAITGALGGGVMLALGLTNSQIFFMLAIPTLIAALSVIGMGNAARAKGAARSSDAVRI